MTKITDRELDLIDGMIEVQLHHAAQCDGIANRTMAEKQKSWDMERVELLRKMRAALAAQPAEPKCSPTLTECPRCKNNMLKCDGLGLQPAEPVEPVACKGIPRKGCNYLAYADTVCNKCGEVHHHHQMLAHFYAAPPAPAAVPPGMALVPIEATPEMVDAYLKANAAYWVRIDQGPPKIGVWRNGTPKEATAEAYRAMIAAAGERHE